MFGQYRLYTQQGKRVSGHTGYPECLINNRSSWSCSTDKGIEFIREFLNKPRADW